MYKILSKEELNSTVTQMVIEAPFVAKKAEPGQFIILRVDKDGEHVPLTIADFDRKKETVTIIFQVVGAETTRLNMKNEGDYIEDFVGPLGNPTKTEGYKKVAVECGGVGTAIAYPVANTFAQNGAIDHSKAGFRNKDLEKIQKQFEAVSDKYVLVSDDGSTGTKGFVTDALKSLIDSGEKYDLVMAIGPIPMMKFVSKLTAEYGIKTVVSMNPIMIDGTGMCGGCRLTVGGETKFACVDGPEFDGHLVDFDEVMERSSMYKKFEREEECNLLKQEVQQ